MIAIKYWFEQANIVSGKCTEWAQFCKVHLSFFKANCLRGTVKLINDSWCTCVVSFTWMSCWVTRGFHCALTSEVSSLLNNICISTCTVYLTFDVQLARKPQVTSKVGSVHDNYLNIGISRMNCSVQNTVVVLSKCQLFCLTETALQNVSMFMRSEEQWQVTSLLPNIGKYSYWQNHSVVCHSYSSSVPCIVQLYGTYCTVYYWL